VSKKSKQVLIWREMQCDATMDAAGRFYGPDIWRVMSTVVWLPAYLPGYLPTYHPTSACYSPTVLDQPNVVYTHRHSSR
jgi:hypothetical protein